MCEESFETVVGCMLEKLKQMLVPTGTVIIRPTTVVPNDFLECNGAEISRVDYAALFEVIGTTYGAGDGVETFNLPDLRGEFVRGFDNSRGVDTDRAIGSWQEDEFKSHNHIAYANYFADVVQSGSNTADPHPANSSGDYDKTTSNSGGSETRPRNIAMMYCIKY